jgi:hypothetical protein
MDTVVLTSYHLCRARGQVHHQQTAGIARIPLSCALPRRYDVAGSFVSTRPQQPFRCSDHATSDRVPVRRSIVIAPMISTVREIEISQRQISKASQSPICHSVACVETVVAAWCRSRGSSVAECSRSRRCTAMPSLTSQLLQMKIQIAIWINSSRRSI